MVCLPKLIDALAAKEERFDRLPLGRGVARGVIKSPSARDRCQDAGFGTFGCPGSISDDLFPLTRLLTQNGRGDRDLQHRVFWKGLGKITVKVGIADPRRPDVEDPNEVIGDRGTVVPPDRQIARPDQTQKERGGHDKREPPLARGHAGLVRRRLVHTIPRVNRIAKQLRFGSVRIDRGLGLILGRSRFVGSIRRVDRPDIALGINHVGFKIVIFMIVVVRIVIARIVIVRIDLGRILEHRPRGSGIFIPRPRRCFAHIRIVDVQVVRIVFA